LTKTGTGTLTLSHANTYNGGTAIRQGAVVVSNATGSATGVGKVQVDLGILRGVGKIDGAVTVGNDSSSGATILGGNSTSPGILTINSTLTFRSFSSYKCALNRASVKASQVSALGVIIGSGATFTFVDVGTGTLPVGTVFTVINNTSASPIAGTFSNLPNGSIFTSNGNHFKVNYTGGTGNDLTLKVVP
jgi:autotransporter-associated beta strand protein